MTWTLADDPGWRDGRAACALLRTDGVIKPLSVDAAVWGSAFDAIPGAAFPAWIGGHIDLWDDLAELTGYLASAAATGRVPRPYWVVAFTVVEELGVREYLDAHPPETALLHVGEARPPAVDPAWEFLGYDVADAGRLSGLSNCLYAGDEEDAPLVAAFRDRVNAYHLFAALGDADAFRLASDRRVPEHAPFFVFGLFRIAEVAEVAELRP